MPTPSSFPDTAEVEAIAAMPDAAARNRCITQAYSELSAEVARRIGGGANWCTFAAWASQQAGVTIRHQDMVALLRGRLRGSLKISGLDTRLIEWFERGQLDVLQLVLDQLSRLNGPLQRSSDAVGAGNRKVFAEIGLQFARWLAAFPDLAAAAEVEMASFCATLAPGPPPDGQDYLRQAFLNYRSAALAADAKARAEWMLLANLQIGFHEQVRLQPDIQGAMDGALIEPQDLVDALLPVLTPRLDSIARGLDAAWPSGESPLEKVAMMLARDVRLQFRTLVTENLMSLRLPPATLVELGQDLRWRFPAILRPIANPAVLTLLAGFDPDPNSEVGSGTRDWANFPQRMRFIADLFCAYGEDAALFDSPPAADQAAGAS